MMKDTQQQASPEEIKKQQEDHAADRAMRERWRRRNGLLALLPLPHNKKQTKAAKARRLAAEGQGVSKREEERGYREEIDQD